MFYTKRLNKKVMKNDNMLPLADFSKVMPLIQKAWDFQAKGYGTTFIDISGHIAMLDIKLFVHGWEHGRNERFSRQIRLNTEGEQKWACFNIDHVTGAINEIDRLLQDLPTEQEVREKDEALRLENQRKQYEALKAKFEPAEK